MRSMSVKEHFTVLKLIFMSLTHLGAVGNAAQFSSILTFLNALTSSTSVQIINLIVPLCYTEPYWDQWKDFSAY